MIEILKFIDDLKEIRDSMPYNNLTKSLVDDKLTINNDLPIIGI